MICNGCGADVDCYSGREDVLLQTVGYLLQQICNLQQDLKTTKQQALMQDMLEHDEKREKKI